MSEERSARRRRWLDRLGRTRGVLLTAAIVGGLLAGWGQIQRWRAASLAGWGLEVRYFSGPDFRGQPVARGIDRWVEIDRGYAPSQLDEQRYSVEWRGRIFMPRTGKYVFASAARGRAWLRIGQRLLLADDGKKPDELTHSHGVRMTRGWHDILVRYQVADPAEPLMRLFWTPARRWGGPEYIPPTVLLPPGAKPRRPHAIPPRDLPAALAMAAALLLAVLLLLRRPLFRGLRRLARQPTLRIDAAIFFALFGAALALRLWDLGAAGQTWDEDAYWTASRNFIQSLLRGDTRWLSYSWNYEHPATGKWLYGIASLASESLQPTRAVSATVGALSCALLFVAGRDLLGRWVGLLAAALCAVMPHVLAHDKVVGLESPSGLFYLLTVWLFYRGLLAASPAPGRGAGGRLGVARPCPELINSGWFIGAGLTLGLVVGTRLSNASVALVLAGSYLHVCWPEIRARRQLPLPLSLAALPLIGVAVFWGSWPYLWETPAPNLARMLMHWKPDPYRELFLGERVHGPLYYYPLYFAVTIPLAGLAMTLVGIARTALRRRAGDICVLLWWVAPFVVIFSPRVRDGVRYLYPALMPASLLAAAGVDLLARALARSARRPQLRVPLFSTFGVLLWLSVLWAGTRVHPYYMDYYSEVVGGVERVERENLFDVGWWGEGLEQAAAYLDRHAERGATVRLLVVPTHVMELRSDLELVESLDADYVMVNETFYDLPQLPHHLLVHAVRAGDAPIVRIYRRRDE